MRTLVRMVGAGLAALAMSTCEGAERPMDPPDQQRDEPVIRILSAVVEGPPVFYRKHGDLWMTTWADDGHLYMGWGDGVGRGDCCPSFGDGPVSNTPTCAPVPDSISLRHIHESEDGPATCFDNDLCCCRWTDAGLLIFQEPPLAPTQCEEECVLSLHVPTGKSPVDSVSDDLDRSDKPSSLLFVDGVMYWSGHYPLGTPTTGYLARSTDYGRTWTEIQGSPWGQETPFRVMMFINMGQAYSLNTDGFVYALAMGTETEWSAENGREDRTIYLARVPRSSIGNYAAYQYHTGTDGTGQPQWSQAIVDARPLPGIQSEMQGSAIYHPGTARYLFLTALPGALYSAPKPWGPWRKVSDLLGDDTQAPGWLPGGYIPGLISKDTGPAHVHFTISGVDGVNHYELTMGTIRLEVAQ